MAKILINEKNRKGHINPKFTDISRSIWADASTRGCMWAKIPIFRT